MTSAHHYRVSQIMRPEMTRKEATIAHFLQLSVAISRARTKNPAHVALYRASAELSCISTPFGWPAATMSSFKGQALGDLDFS